MANSTAGTDQSAPTTAAVLVAQEVRRAAQAAAATLGPRFMALTIKQTSDFVVPGTGSIGESSLGERLAAGQAVTPLANPEVGQGHLGAFGQSPCTGGDVLAASDTDGRRVAETLEVMCAIEAARMAPRLANELVTAHPGLADRLAVEHGSGAVTDDGPTTPAAVLCAEVAAQLVIALIAAVSTAMAHVPVSTGHDVR